MKIIFIMKDNSEKICNFSEGNTILNVAEANGIPIKSFCEGFGVCGACHICIENMQERIPKMSDKENNALDNSSGLTINSRLACQIVLNKDLDGLKVRLL
ncbi:MAG: 2Fe-2S iron-sulfur cluster binding domain-containing protein [Alphaproteobacteria bacterium]|nr:2Fe-2S iron-sulfur cluster binding domain-containing protein [Alphaproteobacteria bacterium]